MPNQRFLAVHTDAPATMSFEIERRVIESAGGELRTTRARSEDELIENVKDADALLVLGARITRRVIENMPNCKLIVRYGVGLDTLDIPAATEHGIVIAHFPDFCQPEVANQAILLLLACAKKLTRVEQAVRSGKWRTGPLGPMGAILGETVGLVGFGNIAQAVVPRAKALGMRVIAFDPFITSGVFRTWDVERCATLEDLLRRSDYVSIHTPLAESTRHLISTEQFAQMKPSAYIINTSRGPVIDEKAMIAALQSGQIAGAGLDVFEVEPLPGDSPLCTMDNVTLMPHSASYSDESFELMKERVGQAVADIIQGRWPEIVHNRSVKARAVLPAR
ncbi:MAG: C-terminal binding protein [Dehalococcoidia bacterium]